MNANPKAIKVGDKIQVEFTVVGMSQSGGGVYLAGQRRAQGAAGFNHHNIYAHDDAIVGHTSKPREVLVGQVYVGTASDWKYTVCGMDGGKVWTRRDNGRGSPIYDTWCADELLNESRFTLVEPK